MAEKTFLKGGVETPKFEKPCKSCCDCHYFSAAGEGNGPQCRIRAPAAALVPTQTGQPVVIAFWPPTRPHFWCGEFEPLED